MTPSVTHRDTCRLCDSPRVELAIRLAPTPIGDSYLPPERCPARPEYFPLDLVFCHDCSHLQLPDAVNPELLFGRYIYVTSSSLGLVQHFARQADAILERVAPPAGSLVVDVGSNDGSLLRAFQARGLRGLGIDPARDIARRATESGVETVPAFFTSRLARELRKKHGPAAVVTANNVFAHSDHLPDMADGVRELLAPDGVFVFEVSYLVDIVDKMLFDTVYHEHLCYHSVRPLDRFLRRHGLETADVERIPSKGGSLRVTAQLAGGPRAVSPRVRELIELELRLGYNRIDVFKEFARRIDAAKHEALKHVLGLKAQGRRLAGYGASPTVTTLLHHFDLGRHLDFLVDDNPIKHGTLSPGHRLPVFPSSALYGRPADDVVILAWNYAGPIVQRHPAFLERGGRFVVPLPRLRVIDRAAAAA